MAKVSEPEIRTATSSVSQRAAGAPGLNGYAAKFNSPANIGGYFIEKIAPGAFRESIASADIRALYNHNSDHVLARTKSGTLKLSEDSQGLRFEVDLPDTSIANDLLKLIERRDLVGCSFGFVVREEAWDDTGALPVRTLVTVDLLEVSICGDPAYSDTSVYMRGAGIGAAGAEAARLRMKRELLDRLTR